MMAWLIASFACALTIFYYVVARARLVELRFTQNALEIALGVLDGPEIDRFTERLAVLDETNE